MFAPLRNPSVVELLDPVAGNPEACLVSLGIFRQLLPPLVQIPDQLVQGVSPHVAQFFGSLIASRFS